MGKRTSPSPPADPISSRSRLRGDSALRIDTALWVGWSMPSLFTRYRLTVLPMQSVKSWRWIMPFGNSMVASPRSQAVIGSPSTNTRTASRSGRNEHMVRAMEPTSFQTWRPERAM